MRRPENKEVKDAMYVKGIATWELVEALGISENTLFRYLRKELPEQTKTEYMKIIEKMGKEVSG